MATMLVRLGESSWRWDPNVDIKEMFAIKAETGLGLVPFLQGVDDRDPDCVQTLLWLLRRPAEPALQRRGIMFRVLDFELENVDEVGPTSASVTPADAATTTSTCSPDGSDSAPPTSTP